MSGIQIWTVSVYLNFVFQRDQNDPGVGLPTTMTMSPECDPSVIQVLPKCDPSVTRVVTVTMLPNWYFVGSSHVSPKSS